MTKLSFIAAKLLRTFQQEGWQSVWVKLNRRFSGMAMTILSSRPKKAEWDRLRNLYEGETVYLIGNGPSLNQTPLYLLNQSHTMVFNRFLLMLERLNWQPTFYSVTDDIVLNDMIEEAIAMSEKADLNFFPDIHFRGTKFYKKISSSKPIFWIRQRFGLGFSEDLPQAYPGGSVIYEGLQILKFLGFQKVVLVGVDMNFKRHTTARNIGVDGGIDIESQHDDDPNHFDPRYFGKGRRYHQPEKHVIDNILHFLSYAQAHAVDDTFTIFNAGLESRVASFPKVDFLETLGLNACEVQKRFEALLTEKTGYSLSEFESEYPFFESKKEVDSHTEMESFIVSIDVGVELIKDKIEDYLPLGPFDKKYYFARRNEPNY